MKEHDQFLWGSATAAYQCEGAWDEDGKGESNWDAFVHSTKNEKGITGDIASNHYHQYEEDIRLMAEGGQNSYRFSLAWSRILPNGTGKVNEQGIEHYRSVIKTCLHYQIVPNVTLFHWDLPKPLDDMGGWENRDTVYAYLEYAKVCFTYFGDLVPMWATVNEPEFYTYCCYAVGNYPPNVQDFSRRSKAGYHLLLASALAVKAYHDGNYQGKIGLVHASGNVETLKQDETHKIAYRNADLFYNKWITDTCVKGSFPSDLYDKLISSGIDLSFYQKEDEAIFMEGTVDYLGINLYSRSLVKPYESGETSLVLNNQGAKSNAVEKVNIKGWFEECVDPSVPRNKWGREIYPKCMYDELKEIQKQYGDIPVYITENGHGCYEKPDEKGYVEDDERIEICSQFIYWMLKARKEGCNVKGYYMWSTMDLYSWINGYEKRYGLVRVDFEQGCKRIPKKSYYWYKNLIEQDRKDGK